MNNTTIQKRTERYKRKIYKVLTEQNFIIGKKEEKIIEKQILIDQRYFHMVAGHKEGDKTIDRFVKIPSNNTKKLLLAFQRQIEVAKFIKDKNIINTRGIIASNYTPKKGTPFAILETFPTNHAKIGFIQKNKGIESLGPHEAKQIIDQLKKFHSISIKTLPPKLKKILRVHKGNYKSFRQEILRYLNKKIKPLDSKVKTEPCHKTLERRLDISDLKNRTKELLQQLEPIIDSKNNRQTTIIHGDMSPDNLYVFDSGDVELLDLEWVGIFKNRAIGMIIDFGNFRARSWNNEKFRIALDQALIDSYKVQNQEKLGKAIVKLGILHSHIRLSGCFENYKHQKQKNRTETRRRVSTEQDISQAFNI